MSWADPGSDPSADIRAAIAGMADQSSWAEVMRIEALLREAVQLQAPDKLWRLVVIHQWGVTSAVASWL